MSYPIDVSTEYIEKLGNIKTKVFYKNESVPYLILNYEEEMICSDDTKRGKYRSIIATYPDKNILSVSIPKNVSLEYFKHHYSDLSDAIYVNELIEGTMIHLFYDPRISSWEIATKRSIGGEYYYQQQNKLEDNDVTFLNMVTDAFHEDRLNKINDIKFISEFDKQYSYQFVLQHPKNHIVFPIKEPKMYLVGVYETQSNVVRFVPPTEYESWSFLKNQYIHFPESYSVEKHILDGEIHYQSLQDEYVSIQTPVLTRMGIMITNKNTGQHCLVMNPTYEEYARVRGNHPDNQFLYLSLRKLGIVMEYLQFFPQYRKLFFRFRDEYETLVNNIHQSYLYFFILKKEVEISKKYMSHIYALHHNVYIPSLATKKIIIKKQIVREYVDSLEPGQIMHIFNYDKREVSETVQNTNL